MKIAMIGQKGIFVTHDGGIETHVGELSRHLVRLGQEVFVYCRPHYNKNLLGKKQISGINLIFQPSIRTKYLDAITHTFLCTLDAMRKKFDVIHYHGVGPSTLSFLPRIFSSRAKVVGTFHSQDRFHAKWGPIARLYLEFGEFTVCKFPHVTISVSKTLRRYCLSRFKKETIYIPNGVEAKEIKGKELIKKWGLEKDSYILSVARFVRHKGLHYLIQAYKNLRGKYRISKKLVLVGESPYPSKYADYLKKLAAHDPDIIFTGYQSGKILDQLFQNAYLYVHPSESEGLSLTILEAMALGNCVLISDIEENLEAVSAFGFYFKNKEEKDLEEKLFKLLKSPDEVLRMGQKAKEFVREEHSWSEIAKKTYQVYRSLPLKKL